MKKKTWTVGLITLTLLTACGSKDSECGEVVVKVKTETVGAERIASTQIYSGTIEEQSGTSLSFAAMGTLKSINVREGQQVSAGQLIGVIDDTQQRNQYAQAKAALDQAKDAEKRMRMLHEGGSLPEVKWVEIETQVQQAAANEAIARKALGDVRLYAPFSGYVTDKSAEVGQNMAPGIPVCKLVKIGHVNAKISVPENRIASIHLGQEVSIKVSALGDRVFFGRITEKGVAADRLTHAYEVKALIDNSDRQLLPGMIAEVKLHPQPQPQGEGSVITLPANIIQLNADNSTFVWTVGSDGRATNTPVQTGESVGSRVAIVRGLSDGDKVITSGQQKVSTGMKVEQL